MHIRFNTSSKRWEYDNAGSWTNLDISSVILTSGPFQVSGNSLNGPTLTPGTDTAQHVFRYTVANANWPFELSTIYDASYVDHWLIFNGRLAGTRATPQFEVPSGASAFGLRSNMATAALEFHVRSSTTGATSVLGYINYAGNYWIAGNCSAESFTDRTKGFTGDALAEIMKIKNKREASKDVIDHDSLPEFARSGNERDLGAMISLLTAGMQQLVTRLNSLESRR